jgi:hypothetical protein
VLGRTAFVNAGSSQIMKNLPRPAMIRPKEKLISAAPSLNYFTNRLQKNG